MNQRFRLAKLPLDVFCILGSIADCVIVIAVVSPILDLHAPLQALQGNSHKNEGQEGLYCKSHSH